MSLRHARRLIATVGIAVVALVALGTPANAAPASAISQRYNSDSGLRHMLGASKGSEYSVAGGREQDFKWGSLYWTSATGVHEVHGAILNRYKGLGGPAGKLGFPITDETHVFNKYDVPDEQVGARSDFAHGALEWISETNKTIWMGKAIADIFPHQLYLYWGVPDGDQHAATHGAQVLSWSYGRIYLTANGKLYFINDGYPSGSNGMFGAYKLAGFDNGPLGLPTGDEEGIGEGTEQTFSGGAIYRIADDFSNADVAHIVRGAIYWSYSHNNGVETLGFPIANEEAAPGGRIQHFEHGTIFWNSSTNATKTTVTH